MALIPTLTISEFNKLKAGQLRQMQSVIVTVDGTHLFTAIIPPQGAGVSITTVIQTDAEYLGYRGNSVGGKTPEVVMGKETIVASL
jgi:hypothetical protein